MERRRGGRERGGGIVSQWWDWESEAKVFRVWSSVGEAGKLTASRQGVVHGLTEV